MTALRQEFGPGAFLPGCSEARALVTAVFRDVQPPTSAVCIGRSSCAVPGALYVREGNSWARIAVDQLLQPDLPFRVDVAPGFDAIRLVGYVLEPLLRVRALLSGQVFVHASAVAVDAQAVLLPAWGNTGKTNLMLELAEAGAVVISDDWTVLLPDGGVAGYPRPINLMNYNLDLFPALRSCLPWPKRTMHAIDRSFRYLRRNLFPNKGLFLRVGDVVERALEISSNARLPLQSYDPTSNGIYPLALLAPVMKTVDRSSSARDALGIDEISRMATTSFFYENARLFDRLAEYNFAIAVGDGICSEIWALYTETFARNIAAAAAGRVLALRLQAHPDRPALRALARDVLSCLSITQRPVSRRPVAERLS